jgi:hypothetical protein
MNIIIKLLLVFSLFFLQAISAQEAEMIKITFLKKNVTVIIGSETRVPKMGEELPLNAIIQCDKTGLLEFKYKDGSFKIENKKSILLSDAVKTKKQENFEPVKKTDAGGVRGLDETKNENNKKNTKRKSRKKKENS